MVDQAIDLMVTDQGIYLGKNDALQNFLFVMAIRTGQYTFWQLSASLYVLFNVDTGLSSCLLKLYVPS